MNDLQREEAEKAAIAIAESGDYDNAVNLLTDLHIKCPYHPSPLNNRAQVYRLQFKDDLAMHDLNAAVALPDASHYPNVMRQVYSQRAWLFLRKIDMEQAQTDFKCAKDLGLADADKMIARCNPYAAMCNAMLAEVMQKLYS